MVALCLLTLIRYNWFMFMFRDFLFSLKIFKVDDVKIRLYVINHRVKQVLVNEFQTIDQI